MAKYKIISRMGVELGEWEADGPEGALDLMYRKIGYLNHPHACEVMGEDPDSWTTSVELFKRGGYRLLVRPALRFALYSAIDNPSVAEPWR